MESATSRSMDRLIARARRGDRSAVDRLMTLCRPGLRQWAGARLPRELVRKQDAADPVAAARQRFSRAVRRVGEALQLLELMTQRGWSGLQQDAIGLHRFQGASPGQIAERLQLPAELVARWIAEAEPLIRSITRDTP